MLPDALWGTGGRLAELGVPGVEAPVGELGDPLRRPSLAIRADLSGAATSMRPRLQGTEISISGNPIHSSSSHESRPAASYLESIVGIK